MTDSTTQETIAKAATETLEQVKYQNVFTKFLHEFAVFFSLFSPIIFAQIWCVICHKKKLQKKPDTIQEVAEETQKKKWSPPPKKKMVKAVSVQTEDVEKSPSPPPEEEVEPIELETRETQVF